MPLSILSVVLVAAVLHAIWNAWVKSTGDATLAMGLISLGWCAAALVALPFLPLPERASLPFLVASATVHLGYMLGLASLYGAADLSRAYVLVRAIPPLIVAIVSATALGDRLEPTKWAGIVLVLAGVLAVSPPSRAAWTPRLVRALVPTVAAIAAYTLLDGVGVRKSGNAASYALWLSVVQGSGYVGLLVVTRRDAFVKFVKQRAGRGLLAGAASVVAYTSILWCMTKAPIGLVAALRESSVLVASFLGAALLRERVSSSAWVGAALVFLGAIVMDAPPL